MRDTSSNPLVERAFHSFAGWFILWRGVSELEKAEIEKIENFTRDALQGLQEEASSLSKVTMQNRTALDLPTAKEGGVGVIITQTCCSFTNQEKPVETDRYQIPKHTEVLQEVTSDNTS